MTILCTKIGLPGLSLSYLTCNMCPAFECSKKSVKDVGERYSSRGLGVNFLPAKWFKRGPPHCVERTFLIAIVG